MSIILPENDGRCGWYDLLPGQPKPKPLQGEQRADVVIIGGGFVGLAAARSYAELRLDHRVILLEALCVGQGASGRNSGFLIDLPHKHDLELRDTTRKQKIHQLNLEAIDDLRRSVQKHQIQCQWSESGKYQAAVGSRGQGYLDNYQRLLNDIDYPYDVLDSNECRKVFGTDYYQSAIYTSNTVLVQPAAMVTGLRQSLPDNVEVYEKTPALAISRVTGGHSIATQGGQLKATRVILANNIFAKEFGYFKTRMIPTMTYASMTRPLSDREMSLFQSEQGWGITPADHGGTTLRLTEDRRLLIRNQYTYVPKYSDRHQSYSKMRQQHLDGLIARYPSLSDIRIEYTWGGACALSRNYAAYFGEIEPGIFYSGIHQSVGATRGTITGKLLAHLSLGENSESLSNLLEITNMPAINPPDPFLSIGIQARMALARLQSKSEL